MLNIQPSNITNKHKNKDRYLIIGCIVLLSTFIIVFFLFTAFYDPTERYSSPENSSYTGSSDFEPALGHMYCGVKLYLGGGLNKQYFGEIKCFKGGSGGKVLIINFAGSEVWAKRNVIINGPYFVRKDDPAMETMLYYNCDE